jgi:four helix bundle protein
MKEVNVVADKSFRFAARVVNLYKFLCAERKEFILSKQLLRSGTAIGALIKESEIEEARELIRLTASIVKTTKLNVEN